MYDGYPIVKNFKFASIYFNVAEKVTVMTVSRVNLFDVLGRVGGLFSLLYNAFKFIVLLFGHKQMIGWIAKEGYKDSHDSLNDYGGICWTIKFLCCFTKKRAVRKKHLETVS